MRRRELLGTLPAATAALAGCSVPGLGRRTDWSVSVGSELPAPLVLADGAVFAASGATAHRLAADSGETEWRRGLDARVLKAVAAADGRLYLGRVDGVVLALDRESGDRVWRERPPVESPAVGLDAGDGVLYAGLADGVVLARDAATGEELWRTDVGADLDEGPVSGGDAVYVGDREGRLYAVDAATGEERWTFDASGGLLVRPTAVEGTVYQGSDAGVLHAVDAATGEERWRHAAAEDGSVSVAVDGDTAYLATVAGSLQALSLDARTVQWRFEEYSGAAAPPAVDPDAVYVGGNTGLNAVSKDSGDRRWKVDAGDAWHQTPRLGEERVYTGDTEGTVYAIGRS
ncbi:PQQ-binding-like beta-propeller repeat protein [Halomicrobium salinisoli]|uniref:outer membrane protein assembly factor BamB family protein n=1 Tax=Halomicrobium salinisoli TaxID=2878391 RepID=UPI001CF01398|nr:PQQ-binding-like beta-propeller repeat protein [Halomicrobium salinisoli]